MKNLPKQLYTLILILNLVYCGQLSAQENEWIGGTGQWNVAANWSKGTIPTFQDTVVININGIVTIPAGYTARAQNCFVKENASLSLDLNSKLNINNSEYYGLKNNGNITCTGRINIGNSMGDGCINSSDASITLEKFGIINVAISGSDGILNEGTIDSQGLIKIDSTNGLGIDNYFSIVNNGEINVKRARAISLANSIDGKIENMGELIIQDSHNEGIVNDGELKNYDEIKIKTNFGTFSGEAIINNFKFTNFSLITIDTITDAGIKNFGTFLNETNAIISADSVSTGILQMEDAGAFMNKGTIAISRSRGDAINLNADFINEAFGHITISNILDDGVFTKYASGIDIENEGIVLTNHGVIIIDGSEEKGFENFGLLTNYGDISISNVQLEVINNSDTIHMASGSTLTITDGLTGINNYAAIENNGTIEISQITEVGLINNNKIVNNNDISVEDCNIGIQQNEGIFTNAAQGQIIISLTSGDGLQVQPFQSPSQFINDGLVSIDNTTDHALNNQDQFVNHGKIRLSNSGDFALENGSNMFPATNFTNELCGEIIIHGLIRSTASTFTNKGLIRQDASGSSDVNATLTNEGIFQDVNESTINDSNFNNQGIVLNPISGSYTCNQTINPIYSGPNTNTISATQINFDSIGTVPAGTIDLTANQFIPSGNFNQNTFWIKFVMPNSCVHTVPLIFDNPIACNDGPYNIWTGDAGTTDWFTAGNWSQIQVPNNTHDVRIPSGHTVVIPAGLTGNALVICVEIGTEFDVQGEICIIGS